MSAGAVVRLVAVHAGRVAVLERRRRRRPCRRTTATEIAEVVARARCSRPSGTPAGSRSSRCARRRRPRRCRRRCCRPGCRSRRSRCCPRQSAPTTIVSPETATGRTPKLVVRARCSRPSDTPAGSRSSRCARRRRPRRSRRRCCPPGCRSRRSRCCPRRWAPTTTVSPATATDWPNGRPPRCSRPSGRPAGSRSSRCARRRRPRRCRAALLSAWLPFTPVALLSSPWAPTTIVSPAIATETAELVGRRRCSRPSGRPAGSRSSRCARRRRPRRCRRALLSAWLPLTPVALLSSEGAPTTTVSPAIATDAAESVGLAGVRRLDVRLRDERSPGNSRERQHRRERNRPRGLRRPVACPPRGADIRLRAISARGLPARATRTSHRAQALSRPRPRLSRPRRGPRRPARRASTGSAAGSRARSRARGGAR